MAAPPKLVLTDLHREYWCQQPSRSERSNLNAVERVLPHKNPPAEARILAELSACLDWARGDAVVRALGFQRAAEVLFQELALGRDQDLLVYPFPFC